MQQKIIFKLLTAIVLCNVSFAYAKVVEYNIDIDYQPVNYTGKTVKAMAVGGSIPGKTIMATEGDTLRVTFNNRMDVATSIHWHGVLLPNDQDGVPYLTTPSIQPGQSFTYQYPVKQSGTYWYHSHTQLQEQRGVYGALIFQEKNPQQHYDDDLAVVISDWIDENPHQVLANLKRDGDYYALKKHSVQSWWGVLQNGWPAIKARLQASWQRMGAMDLSDIAYDAFLINGKPKQTMANIEPGDKVRIRLINAGSSSYFYVNIADMPMQVIAADGMPVKPFYAQQIRMAIAETYDVVVTMPANHSIELRATAEDISGTASLVLGQGPVKKVADVAKPNLYRMGYEHHANHEQHAHHAEHTMHDQHTMHHHHHHVVQQLNDYAPLQAPWNTALASDRPTREVELALTGTMDGFAWSFNNKTLSESDKILIRRGETVQFKLINETMMSHPIHLHGHFFRVLNGKGDYSPLKHTVNVPPMQTVVIEFVADEDKDWFFHCHNLYHMKAGMARVVHYQQPGDTLQSLSMAKHPLAKDNQWFFAHDMMLQTNMVAGELRAFNNDYELALEYDFNYDGHYEIEPMFKRGLTRYLSIYVGADIENEGHEQERVATLGVQYVLPLLIDADLRIDNTKHVRLGLGSDLQLTERGSFHWQWNTDKEYRLGLEYEITKHFALTSYYDSNYGAGVGIGLAF